MYEPVFIQEFLLADRIATLRNLAQAEHVGRSTPLFSRLAAGVQRLRSRWMSPARSVTTDLINPLPS